MTNASRRTFLRHAAGLVAASFINRSPLAGSHAIAAEPLFSISLAQWSLNRALNGKSLDPLDFPKTAKQDFGLDAVEYVNQFFMDKARSEQWLGELKKRGDDLGVKSLLIMCDGVGRLGDPDSSKRTQAVEGHHPWIDAAKFLGCHSIRVNADSSGTPEEQHKLAVDGLTRLTEYGAKHDVNVIVENHGGLSSNGAWLVGVIKAVNHPRCGTLPDFGNFHMGKKADGSEDWYDRYQGVREMMPMAKAVSAKTHDFDADGNETHTDFRKMLRIVLEAGYRGHIGIEYEGNGRSEPDGIRATKALLVKVRDELAADPTFKS